MASTDDLTGAVIAAKYELLRLIRRGMGSVYEAWNVETAERCAVKLLSADLAGDPDIVKRFFIEARAMTTVRSEHVVSIIDSGMDDRLGPFYVMEYLTGEDLADTLKRLGSLNQVAATKILLQAATGLAQAHAHGIVHRDVKPSNLFLANTASGEVKVKVLDFGIAKVKMELFSETFSSVTRTGSLLGTPFYMSPEQVKRANSIDSSADVWSLGVVFWECLTGKLPWLPAESFGELLAAVLTADIGSVQDHASWVRPELAEILRRTLCRELGARLSSAVQLLDELRSLVPDGGRLVPDEITPPAEAERASVAPRLSFADTVAQSGTPVARSIEPSASTPPVGRGKRLALALGAAAVVALAILQLVPPSAPNRRTDMATAPTSVVVVPALEPRVADAPAHVRFALEVGPSGVVATVDGIPMDVVDGRLEIARTPGSSVLVTLTRGEQILERRIAVTASGLSSTHLELPEPLPAPRRAQRERAAPAPTESAVAAVVSPIAAAQSSASTPAGPVLSKEFE